MSARVRELLNASPRASPRRPLGVDLRPVTQQALLLFGAVPVGIALVSLLNNHGYRDFLFGLRVGVLTGSGFCVVAWWRSIRFEGQHLGESADFWARREAFIRPRFFLGSLLVGLASASSSLLLWWQHAPCLAGFLATTAMYCALFLALLWGKVP